MPATALDTTKSRLRLWVLGAMLLVAFAVTVVALSLPEGAEMMPLTRWSHDAKIVGLLGLVGLFVFYVFGEERRLARKDAELQQLMVREVSLRARLAEITELLAATTELARAFDLPSLLALAARRVLSGLEADQSAILLVHPRTGLLEGAAAAGADTGGVKAARVIPGEGVAGYVQASGEPLTIESEEMRLRLAAELGLPAAPGSALCVPLSIRGGVLGVFCVCRSEGGEPLTPAHARMLGPLAEHCAAAIAKSRQDRPAGAAA